MNCFRGHYKKYEVRFKYNEKWWVYWTVHMETKLVRQRLEYTPSPSSNTKFYLNPLGSIRGKTCERRTYSTRRLCLHLCPSWKECVRSKTRMQFVEINWRGTHVIIYATTLFIIYLRQYSNIGIPKYEARVLTTRPLFWHVMCSLEVLAGRPCLKKIVVIKSALSTCARSSSRRWRCTGISCSSK
jgi:hypothetical protein